MPGLLHADDLVVCGESEEEKVFSGKRVEDTISSYVNARGFRL